MAKIEEYLLEDGDEICELGKALSSPVRLEIIKLLDRTNLYIGEIAKELNIPQSSAAFHLKLLEKAGLVRMEEQPGSHGTMKVCSRKTDFANICLLPRNTDLNEVARAEMPVGAFVDCSVFPTCGLCASDGVIGMEDKEYSFYMGDRVRAGLLWTARGYVKYRFPNLMPHDRQPISLVFSMELCSEAPGYREGWKSDITMWINGIECATWTSTDDFGSRRGRYTPDFWPAGSSQYGLLSTWEIKADGSYVNSVKLSDVGVEALGLENGSYIEMMIGNKDNARYIGGFNIFGKSFGNYDQDILMEIAYH